MSVGHSSGRRRCRSDNRRLARCTQQFRAYYSQGPGILAGERRINGCQHGDFCDGAFQCQGYGCRGAVRNSFACPCGHYKAPAALGLRADLGERAVVICGDSFQFGEQRGFRADARQGHVGDGVKIARRVSGSVRECERCGLGREFRNGEIALHDQVAFAVEHVDGERGQGFLPRFGGRIFSEKRAGRGFSGECHGNGCAVGGVIHVFFYHGVLLVTGEKGECSKSRDKNFFHKNF